MEILIIREFINDIYTVIYLSLKSLYAQIHTGVTYQMVCGYMSKKQELLEADLEETPKSAKVALLVIQDKPGIQDTRLQKMAFFVDKIFHCGGEAESYYFGAFSEDLAEEVQTMVDDGTLYMEATGYGLTGYGEELAAMVAEEQPDIMKFVRTLHDFSDDEVINAMYGLFPEYTDKSLIKGRLRRSPRLTFTQIKPSQLEKGGIKVTLTGSGTEVFFSKEGGK
jgi:hypothetical protein